MLTSDPQSADVQTKALPTPHWSRGNGHLNSVQTGRISTGAFDGVRAPVIDKDPTIAASPSRAMRRGKGLPNFIAKIPNTDGTNGFCRELHDRRPRRDDRGRQLHVQ